MPASVYIAAFVFGLVLLIAALLGKELKIAAIELPALGKRQRIAAGALGSGLLLFGATEGRVAGSAPMLAPAMPPGSAAAVTHDHSAKDVHILPNDVRLHIGSIRVERGCAILLDGMQAESRKLRLCESVPQLPQDWQETTLAIGAECVTGIAPIVIVFADPGFQTRVWEYSFAC